MKLGDKLIQLRRERGYSQEQLANMLNVSRQSVSKWEADQSTPEINKLIMISGIFGVSVDSLVKEDVELLAIDKRQEKSEVIDNKSDMNGFHPTRAYGYGFYEYKSKIKIFGLPLVHIKQGYGLQVAKGIIAIGNISIGVISIGGLAVGVITLGGLGLGLLVFAGLALGGIAIGGAAIGICAIGGMAIGMYSIGGFAFASKIAVGGAAFGHTAIGASPRGENVLQIVEEVSRVQIEKFILDHNPRIWRPLLKLMAFIAELFNMSS